MRPSARTASIAIARSGARRQRYQQGDGGRAGVLFSRRAASQQPQSLDRERSRVRIGLPGQRHERVQGPFVFEPLQREGHRPPAHARLSRRIEDGGRELIVRLQAHEREHAESKGRRRRVAARLRVFTQRSGERARFHHLPDHPADWLRRSRVANQPEPLGRATLHQRQRIRQRADQRIARAPVTNQPQRERGHLPHFRIRVAEQRQQRLDALFEPDATDRQRRAAPHARFLIAEQPGQIGPDGRQRRRRDGDRRLPAGRNHRRKRRRSRHRGRGRIAEHALIFQAENPGHLLLERRTGRPGRRGRRRSRRRSARARGGHERQRQHDRTTRHWSLTGLRASPAGLARREHQRSLGVKRGKCEPGSGGRKAAAGHDASLV